MILPQRPQNLPDLLAEHGIPRMRSLAPGHSEKLVCPRCNGGKTREQSLSVTIDPDGDGAVWRCHRGNCGWTDGGKVADAARAVVPFRRHLVAHDTPTPHAEAEKARDAWLYDWFSARGISVETVDAFGCYGARRWFAQGGEQQAIVFQYLFERQLVNRKYRSLDKQLMQDKNPLPTLFNIDAIEVSPTAPEPDMVIWVEGEPDVMAVHEAGFPQVVTLKDGAPSELRDENDPRREGDKRFAALATHADLLGAVKKFILAGDMDEPGKVLREELARRLGRHRCWLVAWPDGCKDAGDTLRLHGAEAVAQAINDAVPYPIEGMQRLEPGTLLALRHGTPPLVMSTGTRATDKILSLPGEGRLIIVTGIPNHGKSSWVMFVKVHLMHQHQRRFLVFSPEMQPWEGYVAQCAAVRAGKPFWPLKDGAGQVLRGMSMTDEEIRDAEAWFRPRMVMLVSDAEDKPPSLEWILERARASVLRDGTTDLLIDPWNEVEHQRGDMTETEYVGRSLQQLRAFGLRHGCNIWIVAHPTKLRPVRPGDKIEPPTMYDINGGANWANKADVGIAIHSPDSVTEVHLLKARFQRWGRRGQKAELEFDRNSGRYSTMGQ
jgi:twinkle protein